jgi:nitroimidazol reductase NimA-like FMN-containing flavoprotein (pyridoxamine 5'-phosphate oxidase superfamily)
MPAVTASPPSERTRVRRRARRGAYEREVVDAILDEALVCHVGFVDQGQPYVLPTIHARVGDDLYLHGSPRSRLLGLARAGAPLCVSATIVDGLVLARSAFHHSMNYRSVVVLGPGREVAEAPEKATALEAVVDHVARGRGTEVRPPSPAELRATAVVAVALGEASAKVRRGPPVDDEDDYRLAVWAGELPLTWRPGPPRPDQRLEPGVPVPASVLEWAARRPAAGVS